MILTEDEAKTKWCPFARESYSADHKGGVATATANRFTGLNDYSRCIASQCMAWRWHTKAFFSVSWPGGTDGAYMGKQHVKSFGSVDLDNDYSLTAYAPPGEQAVGFCGLAGKVES